MGDKRAIMLFGQKVDDYDEDVYISGLAKGLSEFFDVSVGNLSMEGYDLIYYVDSVDPEDILYNTKVPVIYDSYIRKDAPRAVDLLLFEPKRGDTCNIWGRRFGVGYFANTKVPFTDIAMDIDVSIWSHTGDISDTAEFYRSVDCFITSEGEGTRDLECYGCGKPVIYMDDNVVDNILFLRDNYIAAYNHAQKVRDWLLQHHTWWIVAEEYYCKKLFRVIGGNVL